MLTSRPDLQGIYGANDDVAMGVLQAVRAAGRLGDVLVAGHNGTCEALASMLKGDLDFTVLLFNQPLGALMIDKAVEQHLASSCNVTLMKNMPYGTSSEIFSLNVLKTILKTAVVPENTEYLEWYLENDRYFNVNYVESSYQYDPRIRLTLDYEEDFLFFSRVFEHFSSLNPSFILEDVIAYLSENSDVVNINEFKTAKYTQKDLDVSLGI